MHTDRLLDRLNHISALCEGAFLASENNAFNHIAEELTDLICDINMYTKDEDDE